MPESRTPTRPHMSWQSSAPCELLSRGLPLLTLSSFSEPSKPLYAACIRPHETGTQLVPWTPLNTPLIPGLTRVQPNIKMLRGESRDALMPVFYPDVHCRGQLKLSGSSCLSDVCSSLALCSAGFRGGTDLNPISRRTKAATHMKHGISAIPVKPRRISH